MDDRPGIHRIRGRTSFHYVKPDGRPVKNSEDLARIKGLVIPPAWTEVWIAPIEQAHLQATGRDSRGRKQYRYHDAWRQRNEQSKFKRMISFARVLPRVRRRVQRDLRRRGMPREKILAAVVRLLELTLIRVGNDEYARTNGSFGLTTLRNRHAEVKGAHVRFSFKGKSGKEHNVEIFSPRLARIVKRCQDLPGQELFEYVDESGERRQIDSQDVNDYIREAAKNDEFTAKDFRTWEGTVLAATALWKLGRARTDAEAKQHVVKTIKAIAEILGNTPAVCRKSYIHPGIFECYLCNRILKISVSKGVRGLSEDESRALSLLLQIEKLERLSKRTSD